MMAKLTYIPWPGGWVKVEGASVLRRSSPRGSPATTFPGRHPPPARVFARAARVCAPTEPRRRRHRNVNIRSTIISDAMARRVRIQQLPNGQFVITIPKALAEAIWFRKGEEVQWSLEKEGLVLRRITRKR